MKRLAAFSIKGGVGKTTATVNLAPPRLPACASLVWDLDPQGAASHVLRIDPEAARWGQTSRRPPRRAGRTYAPPTSSVSTWCPLTSRCAISISTSTTAARPPAASTSCSPASKGTMTPCCSICPPGCR